MTVRRIALLYWGRRGAFPRLVLDLWRATRDRDDVRFSVYASSSNALIDVYRDELGPDLNVLKTFESVRGALGGVVRAGALRRDVREVLQGKDAAVWIIPHVWTPLVAGAIRSVVPMQAAIIHDAHPHPGDVTALATPWINAAALRMDRVFTLSDAVADTLISEGRIAEPRLHRLFHPTFSLGASAPGNAVAHPPDAPLHVLMFGRLAAYKGLPLLVEAADLAARAGVAMRLGVFGEGSLDGMETRLAALGAEVCNRWIDDAEASKVFARYDVVALPYRSASQSGVAAVALGAGLPVVATNVGALAEQVRNGVNGLVTRVDAADFSAALVRLATDATLRQALAEGAKTYAATYSMAAFVDGLLAGLS